jgi:hypothetical protein
MPANKSLSGDRVVEVFLLKDDANCKNYTYIASVVDE